MVVVNEARKRGFVTTAQRFDHAPIVGHRDCAFQRESSVRRWGGRQGEGRGGGARVEGVDAAYAQYVTQEYTGLFEPDTRVRVVGGRPILSCGISAPEAACVRVWQLMSR